MSVSCEAVARRETALCADCVEPCPLAGSEDLFVVGQYELDAATGAKRGRLALCRLAADLSFAEEAAVDTAAVFDARWRGGALAQADADGCVVLYELEEDERKRGAALRRTASAALGASALFVEWSPTAAAAADDADAAPALVVSQSDGSVALLDCGDGALRVARSWRAHELEAWTAAFAHDARSVFTGADDCAWKRWDVRAPAAKPVFADARSHGAGVCTIQPERGGGHRVATGSYDERLRVWDERALRRPLAEHRLGDGVWRVKWHPRDPSLLLTGCMRAGFHVLALLDGESAGVRAVASYTGHGEDLAYGCAWMGDDAVVSCSFYERQVHSWRTPRAEDGGGGGARRIKGGEEAEAEGREDEEHKLK